MREGYFYFLTEQFFLDFPNQNLMTDKETVNGRLHQRPCYFLHEDPKTHLFWMIPISSKVAKYEALYHQKMARYNRCDTIVFGEVLGQRRAFLIQNICPVSRQYIKSEYTDRNNVPVRVTQKLEKELREKATRVVELVRQGRKLVFPDILYMEARLLKNNHK